MRLVKRSDDNYEGHCPFHKGCLEGLTAGPAVGERWGKKGAEIPEDHVAWDLEGYYIGQACASFVLILSPKKIILGGGVMHKKNVLPAVHKYTKEFLNDYIQKDEVTKNIDSYIITPGLGDNAGIVGSRTWRMEPTLYTEEGNKNPQKVSLPITLIDGLNHQNIKVNPSCEKVYANKPFPSPVGGSEVDGSFAEPFSVNEPGINKGEFSELDVYNDGVIVVIGRMSGEGREYIPGERGIANKSDGSKSTLNLSNSERELINVANEIAPGKVIVLVNSAIPMEIEELKNDNRVSSILWIGLPGLYGMDGVAKVISGAINPSGSLPDVFAVDASASPAAQNYEARYECPAFLHKADSAALFP